MKSYDERRAGELEPMMEYSKVWYVLRKQITILNEKQASSNSALAIQEAEPRVALVCFKQLGQCEPRLGAKAVV